MEGVLAGPKPEAAAFWKSCAKKSMSFLSCSCPSRVKASDATGRTVRKVKSMASSKSFFRNDPNASGGGINGSTKWPAFENSCILHACEDEYGGMIVDPDNLPRDEAAFARALAASLSYWKSAGKKGVWLTLPLDRSEYVPVAVKEGFKYHHAEEAYVMLTYWIPDEPCMLPANASHQVGVGGFVINDQMEVLVVQEKYSPCAHDGAWKLPTGFILASEEIFTGAVREVKEEIGIDTEFVEVIAFRHAHNVAFQKSDLFFICMLRPVSNEIKIDEMEIQAAKWMPLAEFVEQPLIQGDHMFREIIGICIQRLRRRYCGLTAQHVISKFDGRTSCLYSNVVEPQDADCNAA